MELFDEKTFISDEDRLHAIRDKNGFVYTADGRKLIGYEGNETKLKIKKGVELIADCVFAGTAIESVQMSDSVTVLGNEVFKDCISLYNVCLSDKTTFIGQGAFFHCEKLRILDTISTYDSMKTESFILPKYINVIRAYTFCNCNSLLNPIFPPKLTKIGVRSFMYSRVIKLSIPKTVVKIDDEAFYGCDMLDRIYLPSSLKSIGSNILAYCPSLKHILIDKGTYSHMQDLLPEYENYFLEVE